MTHQRVAAIVKKKKKAERPYGNPWFRGQRPPTLSRVWGTQDWGVARERGPMMGHEGLRWGMGRDGAQAYAGARAVMGHGGTDSHAQTSS